MIDHIHCKIKWNCGNIYMKKARFCAISFWQNSQHWKLQEDGRRIVRLGPYLVLGPPFWNHEHVTAFWKVTKHHEFQRADLTSGPVEVTWFARIVSGIVERCMTFDSLSFLIWLQSEKLKSLTYWLNKLPFPIVPLMSWWMPTKYVRIFFGLWWEIVMHWVVSPPQICMLKSPLPGPRMCLFWKWDL